MTHEHMSLADCNEQQRQKYHTKFNTFADFPVGCRVQVICIAQDMNFFKGTETGKVIRNSGEYLGIIVEFDEPRHFEGGHIQTEFNFAPDDLIRIDKKGGCMDLARLKELGFKRLSESFINKKEIKAKMKVAYKEFSHVTQEKIDAFNQKLNKKRLQLSFTRIEDYENGIPTEETLKALEEAKKKSCFDYFEICKVTEIKDPILFGRIAGCPDRFFIAQWGEDITVEDILMGDDENVKATHPCEKKE